MLDSTMFTCLIHYAMVSLITVVIRLLGNAKTGPLFTDSYHCNQLLTKYPNEPHIADSELWYAHQVYSADLIPKVADSLHSISNSSLYLDSQMCLQESRGANGRPDPYPPSNAVRQRSIPLLLCDESEHGPGCEEAYRRYCLDNPVPAYCLARGEV